MLFGRPTGLVAITGDGTVVDLDTGEIRRDGTGFQSNMDPVPLGTGALVCCNSNQGAEYVDRDGHVVELGGAQRTYGTDGVHAWLGSPDRNGGGDLLAPIDPTTLRQGPPVRAYAFTIGATGPRLAFLVQPSFDTPRALQLYDPATGGRVRRALPPDADNVVVGGDVAFVVSQRSFVVCSSGPCSPESARPLALDGVTKMADVRYGGVVSVAPSGWRAVVLGRVPTLVDVRTGATLLEIPDPPDGKTNVSWGRDGTTLISNLQRTVLVLANGTVLRARPLPALSADAVLVPKP